MTIRDAHSPDVMQFHPLRWYPADPQWRLKAIWIPATAQEVIQVATTTGTSFHTPKIGYAEFVVKGTKHKLTPVRVEDGKLFFIFLDATRSKDTDRGGRFLLVDLLRDGVKQPGPILLDFNEATNPYCEYSIFTSCPMATRENTLPFTIRAGEKRYRF